MKQNKSCKNCHFKCEGEHYPFRKIFPDAKRCLNDNAKRKDKEGETYHLPCAVMRFEQTACGFDARLWEPSNAAKKAMAKIKEAEQGATETKGGAENGTGTNKNGI